MESLAENSWNTHHNAAHAQVRGFDPLSGVGGLHRAGRWHHKGQPVLYAARNPAMALLEVLVHETSESFRERTLLQLGLEDDAEIVTPQRLLRLLTDSPPGAPEEGTRDFGTNWLREQRSLALLVPSIVMPYEQNIVINPAHPRADSLRVAHSDVVTLDQRLLRVLGSRQESKAE